MVKIFVHNLLQFPRVFPLFYTCFCFFLMQKGGKDPHKELPKDSQKDIEEKVSNVEPKKREIFSISLIIGSLVIAIANFFLI